MHIAGFSHVALTVADMGAARAFWVDVMGFEAAVEYPAALLVLVDARARVAIACVTQRPPARLPGR